MNMAAGFERLRVYQLALEGVVMIYQLTRDPAIAKDFSLVDQIRRAALSVMANIAEGYGRRTQKDFAQFVSIAMGSVNEVLAFLQVIERIYPKVETVEQKDFYAQLGKQLWAFRKKLISNS
jgi:four helix bundle protein